MKAAWWSNVKIVTQKKQASMKQISKPVFLRCGKITEVVRVCLKNAFRTPPQAIWNEFWLRYCERSEQ